MYNSLSYKTKQLFFRAIKLSIVIGCSYFVYTKLVENNQLHFSDFWLNTVRNDVFLLKNIVFLLFFTIFNWFFEILKWKNVASFIKKTSFLEATKQSVASLTASLITPNRVGEYGAKALYYQKSVRKQLVGLNIISNFYQMMMTIIFGIVGFTYFVYQHNVTIDFYRIFRLLLLAVFLMSAFFFGAKHFSYKGYSAQKARQFIKKIPKLLNLKIALYSLLRYVIFSHQFYFLVLLFKVDISYIDALSAITSVYFIASIVPMLSIFDVVLKGTVALWVFSFFAVNELTVLSITTLMWLFNFVLPALIGSYFVLTFKRIEG